MFAPIVLGVALVYCTGNKDWVVLAALSFPMLGVMRCLFLCKVLPLIPEKARALRKRLQRHDLSTLATPTLIVLDFLARDRFDDKHPIAPDQLPFLQRSLPEHPTYVMRCADKLVEIFRKRGRGDMMQILDAMNELEHAVKMKFTT
jgi:hypothetical protein